MSFEASRPEGMPPCGSVSGRMRSLLASAALFLSASTALAQSPAAAFFGDGKPFVFVEQPLDRRFQRTRMYKELTEGPSSAPCASVIGGLLTALAETAPALHKRDDN